MTCFYQIWNSKCYQDIIHIIQMPSWNNKKAIDNQKIISVISSVYWTDETKWIKVSFKTEDWIRCPVSWAIYLEGVYPPLCNCLLKTCYYCRCKYHLDQDSNVREFTSFSKYLIYWQCHNQEAKPNFYLLYNFTKDGQFA